MHPNPMPPSGSFDPSAEADDTVAVVAERAAAGWTAEQVEADMIEAGFSPEQAADVIDAVWTVVL
jgi:hypothetical protein